MLISSWAYDQAVESGIPDLTDNRAVDVPCYHPGYTLVEKLLEEISFLGSELEEKTQTIDAAYVNNKLSGLIEDQNLRQYIL